MTTISIKAQTFSQTHADDIETQIKATQPHDTCLFSGTFFLEKTLTLPSGRTYIGNGASLIMVTPNTQLSIDHTNVPQERVKRFKWLPRWLWFNWKMQIIATVISGFTIQGYNPTSSGMSIRHE